METRELISKKELLELTGISYGQLYRWKRENLIPESWFLKQSSFTGQETFFPKEKILKRVTLILEYKDKYSLEQLASLIHPDRSRATFSSEEVAGISQLKPRVIKQFERHKGDRFFRFSEIRMMMLLSIIYDDLLKNGADIDCLTKSMLIWAGKSENISHRLTLLNKNNVILYQIHPQDSQIMYDADTKVIASYNLDDVLEGFERRFFDMVDSTV